MNRCRGWVRESQRHQVEAERAGLPCALQLVHAQHDVAEGSDYPAPPLARLTKNRQCLGEVGNQVVGMFDADADPDQAVGYASRKTDIFRHA